MSAYNNNYLYYHYDYDYDYYYYYYLQPKQFHAVESFRLILN